jgi:hypothetical protein
MEGEQNHITPHTHHHTKKNKHHKNKSKDPDPTEHWHMQQCKMCGVRISHHCSREGGHNHNEHEHQHEHQHEHETRNNQDNVVTVHITDVEAQVLAMKVLAWKVVSSGNSMPTLLDEQEVKGEFKAARNAYNKMRKKMQNKEGYSWGAIRSILYQTATAYNTRVNSDNTEPEDHNVAVWRIREAFEQLSLIAHNNAEPSTTHDALLEEFNVQIGILSAISKLLKDSTDESPFNMGSECEFVSE